MSKGKCLWQGTCPLSCSTTKKAAIPAAYVTRVTHGPFRGLPKNTSKNNKLSPTVAPGNPWGVYPAPDVLRQESLNSSRCLANLHDSCYARTSYGRRGLGLQKLFFCILNRGYRLPSIVTCCFYTHNLMYPGVISWVTHGLPGLPEVFIVTVRKFCVQGSLTRDRGSASARRPVGFERMGTWARAYKERIS